MGAKRGEIWEGFLRSIPSCCVRRVRRENRSIKTRKESRGSYPAGTLFLVVGWLASLEKQILHFIPNDNTFYYADPSLCSG
jgi:hypothetical protein